MNQYIYFGTYTQNWPDRSHRKEGIFIYRYSLSSGLLTFHSSVNDVTNPSFLAMHPNRRAFYCVNEGEGAVSSFAVDRHSGSLTFLNQVTTGGEAPCYLSLDPEAKWVLVSNYGTGSLAVFPILEDGRLGPYTDLVQHQGSGNTSRQEGAHAHSIIHDPSGKFVLAADLGIDRVLIYRLDRQSGRLIPNQPESLQLPAGSGPRHMVFHPYRRVFYVANELNSTVVACHWDPDLGALSAFQFLSTLPEEWKGESYVADIHLTPDGANLYVSNRGHHSLTCYKIAEDGSLKLVGHVATGGEWPRNFAIFPDGETLLAANERSDNVVEFKIDANSGLPKATGQVISVPKPVCVLPVLM